MSEQTMGPSPALFFDTINAYQRTSALKAALELDLFTAIGEGNETAQQLAERCEASPRGMRILCDYLTVIGFLIKEEDRYRLTQDSAVFLSRNSPAYVGGATEFLLSPLMLEAFDKLTDSVQRGGTVIDEGGTVAPEHPVWVKFARAMAPIASLPAQLMVNLAAADSSAGLKVFDIAAGHGLFGIAFAQNYPNAEITALDWPNVLEVAKENARAAGVEDRYSTIAGSALDVDFGSGYDVVLLTNFLHHFDPETCEKLLKKVHAALADSGRVITLEFIPDEDRISPPPPAMFSLMMLSGTPAGDAYTFSDTIPPAVTSTSPANGATGVHPGIS
ncbi:MAG: methyltransferase domain-containing protein, partial [Blastocatellia bacterium]|nr:methyltransferase domain-containing protein [Blastocatellia bacterium]